MTTILSLEEFENIYKPTVNPRAGNPEQAEWGGWKYDFIGPDYEAVLKADPMKVWTIMETDDGAQLVVVNGLHMVNRMGYIITEKQHRVFDQIEVID